MENTAEAAPKQTPARNNKHRVWIRIQRSTPDGSPAGRVADADFELSLSPSLSADLKIALRSMVDEFKGLQALEDERRKRFKVWKRSYPLISDRVGDDDSLYEWWNNKFGEYVPTPDPKPRRKPTPKFPGKR